ncbi:hypothetical protein LQZ24_00885 [Fructobacillus sp. M1-13]|uniref:MFS transporter n=1 Tax=Fructobacillus papyriferae TaxID=2713171 RepID=A0ABS5QNB4_9LACO|nr:MFS transporter [Fructobacillus papyriferae]MBS9334593.1 MFS transporter [Fructobacillus papyriferae]MCD2158582.1 hypothetical protein [Fructobacillus papyriferae]
MSIRLLSARLISQFGDLAFNAVLDLWILQLFSSTQILAQSMMIASLANFLASLMGGYLADSSRLFKATVSIQLLSCGLSVLGFFLFSRGHVDLLSINLILFSLNLANYTFSPIMKQLIHAGIQKERMPSFNQQNNLFSQILTVVIPPLAVSLFSLKSIDLPTVLLLNGCSFLLSLILLLPIRNKIQRKPKKQKNSYREALGYLYKNKPLQCLIVYGFLLSCYAAQLNVFLPNYYVHIKGNASQYAAILLLIAIVGIAAAVTYPLFQKGFLQKSSIYIIMIALIATPIFLVCDWSLYLIIIISNTLMVHFAIFSQNTIQLTVESKQLGKVFSLLFIALNIAMPVGHFLAGQASRFSLQMMVTCLGFTLLLLLLARLFLDQSIKKD